MSQEPGFEGSGGPSAPPPPPGAPLPGPPAAPPSTPSPGWGAPGAVPPGQPPAWGAPSPSAPVAWDAPQASSGNGCLRACLVVGAILVAIAIVAIVALVILGGRLAQQINDDPQAFLGGPCPYVSDVTLSSAVGEDVSAMTLEGFADGTMGAVLDKRLLPDAPDCWVIGTGSFAARIAVADGDGPATFDAASSAAADRGFQAAAVPDLGDEAFCTTLSNAGSAGILVRWGERVVYASVVARGGAADACDVAARLAGTLEP